MYVCILDGAGQVLVHRNVPSTPGAFLEIVAPYRTELVVAAECMFTWYWLADVCAAEAITFVLGHALAMKAIHGGKAKNDKIDSHTIAVRLRGGMLPHAYVYPAAMRSTRDLLRRRLHVVRKRGELLAHIHYLVTASEMCFSSSTKSTLSAPLNISTNRSALTSYSMVCVLNSIVLSGE